MIVRMHNRFNFGKYKGFSVKRVVESDPDYIFWAISNTSYQFGTDVYRAARTSKYGKGNTEQSFL